MRYGQRRRLRDPTIKSNKETIVDNHIEVDALSGPGLKTYADRIGDDEIISALLKLPDAISTFEESKFTALARMTGEEFRLTAQKMAQELQAGFAMRVAVLQAMA